LFWAKYNDKANLKHFLNNNPHLLPSNVWVASCGKGGGNGAGFYGAFLKSQTLKKKPPTTSKQVQKRTNDHTVLATYSTIAKAAQAEGMSAAKMSRILNQGIKFQDHYYCIVNQG
jgi:hypothetical protein